MMFSTKLHIRQQPSSRGCYCLHYIFLLHICTAFLMIISALNNDEATIQFPLSEDVSFDSQLTDLEAYRALLINLLQPYDEQIKLGEDIVDESSPEDSLLSIRFIPRSLHFHEQSIAIPRMQTVMIINDNSEPLELKSISGNTTHFYSSFFKQTILPAHGGNTSINIYCLPRMIDNIQSVFTIETNRGELLFHVYGKGISNPFRLRSLISATVPLNSTFEYTIDFYNPYNYSIDINEIYTSDENLNIDLLSKRNIKNKITKNLEFYEQWHLKPYEVKSVIKIKYWAFELNHFRGFVCIQTNATDFILLPVKINVLNHPGIYSNVDLLEFSPNNYIHSTMKPITRPIYIFNNDMDPLLISNVRVPDEHQNYMTVSYKTLPVPADIYRLNRIAEITLYPSLIPTDIQHLTGDVQVYTTNDEQPRLRIPFDEIVYHGLVDYEKENTRFFIPSPNRDDCQPIKFINRYNIPLSVYNITIDNPERLSPYIEMGAFSSILYLYPNQWTELLCINLRQQSLSTTPFINVQTALNVHTNLSSFPFPIYLYNGFLSLNLVTDHTNGGIQVDNANPLEFYLVSIPVHTSLTVTFILTNTNPIDVQIDNVDSTLSNMKIQLNHMESLADNHQLERRPDNISTDENISQLIIPEQHRAVFRLTIDGGDQVRVHNESITFRTIYQTLRININYQTIDGSLQCANKTPIHINASLNRIETIDVFLNNKFNTPVNVLRMEFETHKSCFTFTWPDPSVPRLKLQSNRMQRLGKLRFDMAPLCKTVPSELTVYCGLNHHVVFKRKWDEHVSALNTYELDYTLVKQFRNLWLEWTSLIQKQKIQTHVWIYTDRANISVPISIGFIWPSVLEHMFSLPSCVPIILDFQVIFINITKTKNIIISNPSPNSVIYTVELLCNNSESSKQIIDDRIFTIATPSKRVDLINGVYNFYLQPAEQMKFTIAYRPTQTIKHEMYFIVRNNLTVIESILLRGEGGIGSLQVGHREASSPITPIDITIDEKQHTLCSNPPRNLLFRKTITLYNTGNMKTIIYDISFDQNSCSGYGFSTPVCGNIEIESNEKYSLHILYQPDYTTDEINRTLTLNTNIGLMTFPIHVRIPQRVLSACYQIVPRPVWELRTYYLCFCSLLIMFILIFFAAVYDARRTFDNYLTRVGWRDLMETTNNKIFDLSDLSLAVQKEEKTRERIESLIVPDTKKGKTSDLAKNPLKAKRSTTPVNEKKEAIGKPRTSSGSSSLEVKPIQDKIRRLTTDGSLSKTSKEQSASAVQSQSRQRKKSDQRTSPAVPKGISSSTVSYDENEQFVLSRSRRLSSKTKKLSLNTTPTSTVDINPIQSSRDSNEIYSTKPDDSIKEKQWKVVHTTKGHRKTQTSSRREAIDVPQTTNKTAETFENQTVPSSTSTTQHSGTKVSRRRRRPTPKDPSPVATHNLAKRNSLQDSTPISNANRELAFRQLTEQLWAAGLPSAATACSMSIRSRCSSAPPSERGGNEGEEDLSRSDDDDDLEENLDWDEPDIPDDDFGRYALQSELDTNERTQTQHKSISSHIPPLMSLSITPPAMTTSMQERSTTPTSVIKENIEPVSFPQHTHGPIQRPNKLNYSPPAQSSATFADITQSPTTPDVLVQINHLLDHQNSVATVPSTPDVSNSATSGTLPQDLATPNVPWTPFAPNDWATKYDSTWPTQTPSIPLTTHMPNPFVFRQMSKEESTVWPTALGTATPRSTPLNTRSKQGNEWNEMFQPTTPSSADVAKPTNNNWSKFLPAADSSSVENSGENKQENEGNTVFWNSMTSSSPGAQWWPKTSSNENTDNKDQSRWDFAR
ncbi:unnamed protein product [Adineta ricciae]|uniref:Transmembrane protein n=1 Tax=Adineta ricciae TaxID=249248 RepID=A0A814T7I6_ADIRI|nr:unnamed protein product [Adineta ricciae]